MSKDNKNESKLPVSIRKKMREIDYIFDSDELINDHNCRPETVRLIEYLPDVRVNRKYTLTSDIAPIRPARDPEFWDSLACFDHYRKGTHVVLSQALQDELDKNNISASDTVVSRIIDCYNKVIVRLLYQGYIVNIYNIGLLALGLNKTRRKARTEENEYVFLNTLRPYFFFNTYFTKEAMATTAFENIKEMYEKGREERTRKKEINYVKRYGYAKQAEKITIQSSDPKN